MKILCLGDNTKQSHLLSKDLSQQLDLPHHGMIDNDMPVTGVWHTSVMDASRTKILHWAQQCDRVLMLAIPFAEWSHPDAWLRTVEIIDEVRGEFCDPDAVSRYRYWQQYLSQNPSFCILPWVQHMSMRDHTVVCCRSTEPVSHDTDPSHWRGDADHERLRKHMLAGTPLPRHCSHCYRQEQQQEPSDRWRETLEWTNRLSIDSVEDLGSITHPVYFEMRASNKCNLRCRSCGPQYSHLIAHEQKKLGILPADFQAEFNNNRFDQLPVHWVRKLYVAGGEPTIMPEFHEFLARAIAENHTDLEILINTNGTMLGEQLRQDLTAFSNVTVILSIDGVGAVNDYIRSNSVWCDVIANWRWLINHGFNVCVNTTVSIYNAARLHDIFEFLDHSFPDTAVNLLRAVAPQDLLNPDNHPDRDRVQQSIQQCLLTRSVNNGPNSRSWLESWSRNLVSHQFDKNAWLRFLDYNHQLDRSRSTVLTDVLPELDLVDNVNTGMYNQQI